MGHNRGRRFVDPLPVLGQLLMRGLARSVRLGLVGLLACTAACSDGSSTETSTPEFGNEPGLPAVGFVWRDSLPFYFSNKDNERLYSEWQRRLAQCMRAIGIDYVPIVYPKQSDQFDRVNPLDRGYAERYGYSSPPVQSENVNDTSDPAFSQAFDGVGGSPGCYATSYQAVYGSFNDFIALVDQTIASMESALRGFDTSTDGSALTRAWSGCMNERGYEYSNPNEPLSDFGDENPPSGPNIRVRLAALDCDLKSGLTAGRHEYESVAFAQWVAENDSVIQELSIQKQAFDSGLSELEQT